MAANGGRRPKLTFFEEQLIFELRAIRLAILDHSKNTGKWLSIVAQAAANPADNSAEVQQAVNKIAAQLDLTATEQQDALDKFNQTKEN